MKKYIKILSITMAICLLVVAGVVYAATAASKMGATSTISFNPDTHVLMNVVGNVYTNPADDGVTTETAFSTYSDKTYTDTGSAKVTKGMTAWAMGNLVMDTTNDQVTIEISFENIHAVNDAKVVITTDAPYKVEQTTAIAGETDGTSTFAKIATGYSLTFEVGATETVVATITITVIDLLDGFSLEAFNMNVTMTEIIA